MINRTIPYFRHSLKKVQAPNSAAAVLERVNPLKTDMEINQVIRVDAFTRKANRVGFVNISGLVLGRAAVLHMIGVVGQGNLDFLVDSAHPLCRPFLLQNIQQHCGSGILSLSAFRLLRIGGNIPGLAGEKRARYTAFGAVVTHTAL